MRRRQFLECAALTPALVACKGSDETKATAPPATSPLATLRTFNIPDIEPALSFVPLRQQR
jgi:hypothetical protein